MKSSRLLEKLPLRRGRIGFFGFLSRWCMCGRPLGRKRKNENLTVGSIAIIVDAAP